jgi:hypothetical protein
MPLTFAHPAAVLPAKYLPEKWVSMTGLIIGSITPDFEYFIRMKVESIYSHTWIGMFWLDLPLSLLLTFIYHSIVRNPFICNSPLFLKRRLSRYMHFKWLDYFMHNFFKVIICLLVGIATHIFWDGFTHPHAEFVKMIPFLKESTVLFGHQIPNSTLLHAISSIVGGAIVFYAIMRIPRADTYAPSHHPVYYWFIILASGLVTANIGVLTGLPYVEYVNVITATASGFIAGSIIAPLFLEKRVLKL